MFVFFSCRRTMRLSTESSMQRRVIVQGRDCPMRWHRSADCHSAAGFHHLDTYVSRWYILRFENNSRVNNEDVRGLCEVQGDPSSLQRHKEALHLHVLHEVIDGSRALSWSHTAVQHDGSDARATQSPLNELKHSRKLGEDDRLVSGLVGPKLVKFVDEQLDLGRRDPILHFDSIDDTRFLNKSLILLNLRLL